MLVYQSLQRHRPVVTHVHHFVNPIQAERLKIAHECDLALLGLGPRGKICCHRLVRDQEMCYKGPLNSHICIYMYIISPPD